jgi:hypothetical protein
MLNYRLYTLREADGPFVDFEDLTALDDVEAVRIVKPATGTRPMELWCGKRKVKSFPVEIPEAV